MIERDNAPKTKTQLLAHYDKNKLSQAQRRITQHIKLQLRDKKNAMISNLILNTLKNHFIFYNLSDNELQNIKDKMFYSVVEQNSLIYQEGSIGECFFIVQSGQLQMTQQGKFKKQLRPPTGFGQIALLYSTQRTNEVRAVTKSQLWVIDRTTFRSAVQEVIIREYNENRKCLEGVRFFSQLNQQQKDIVASTLIVQKFYKNQNVVQEGDPGSSLYFIKDGSVSVYKGQKYIRKLGRGDSFGEQSLYYNTMRQFTIKADQEVTCLVLGRDTLNRILGDKIYDVTFKNFIKWSFEKNKIMSRLSKSNAMKIIEEMNISSFKANESIFRKGTPGFQKLVVIIEGGLKNLKNGVTVATKGQCYGQEYLLSINKNKTLQDEIVTTTYSVIAQISNHQFFQVIQSLSFQDVIKRDEQKRGKQFIKYDNTAWKKRAKKYPLQQFILVQQVAKGQFGQIFLVRDPENNLYVLKSYEKKQIYEYDVDKFILDEKNVLMEVNYPFVINTAQTFQTENILFFLNQFILGINLQQGLKEIGLLSTEDCQFYTANIILLLQYFEQMAIICRDIKPQNFMIDERGYLKLITLSTAKISRSETNQLLKTYTIIGTPHYMAPDIILGKGYNNLVDLWSLGVCLYEFLSGVLPYGDSADGAYEIYQQIMKGQLRFPEFITDRKAKKLIQQLLSHNPEQRHGGSFNILKANPFFQNFDWDQFYQPEGKPIIQPPFPPNKNKQLVLANARMASNNIMDTIKNMDKLNPVDREIDHDPFKDFGEYIKY